MPLVPRNILKEYFMRGDRPTEGQFGSLLDSTANLVDDRFLLGLRTYDTTKAYVVGDTMIYNNALYQCIADTSGVFNPAKWQVIASLGSVVYSGIWDAAANSPTLADGTGVKGYYYVVNVAGTRDLGSGPIDFQITDWVIYNGSIWEKVDNSEAPVVASDVAFTPNGSISSTNVQDAIDEVRDDAQTEFLLKADKVVGATLNDIATLDASGNLLDSGKKTTDFLASTTVAVDIPFTPNGDITSTNVQDAIVEVRDDTDTKLLLKADKVVGGTLDDLVKLDASGNLVDSGKKTTDFLASTTVAVDIPFTPNGDISATNVQAAIVEVRDDTNTKLALKSDKVVGATLNDIATLDASGNLLDSGKKTTDFLASTTVAVDIPFTPNGDITSTNVQDAIVEVRDDTDTKLLTKLSLSGGTMTGDLVLFSTGTPPTSASAASKTYVDTKIPLAGGTMTGDLILFSTGTPPTSASAASKNYVDTKVGAVPAQVKAVVMPFTFGTIYSTTSSAYTRIPIQISVPAAADVFPGTTTITVKIFADYLTTNNTTTGKVALLDFTDYAGGAITPVTGSDTTLPQTNNTWQTLTGSSFTITPAKSYSLVIERTAGTGSVQLEGGSIILIYS